MAEPTLNSEVVARVAQILSGAERVLFITGAGLSADSGLPTYRGVSGLYNDRDTEDGISIEEALSGATLKTRPALTWKHINNIAMVAQDAKFNRGHEVIAQIEADPNKHVVTLTQNVDGLHRAAGSKRVIDIHGDIHAVRCSACDYRDTVEDYTWLDRNDLPPRCPQCQATVRPEVVLFGEMLPVDRLDRLRTELESGFDMVFTIGTTSVFPYIAGPVLMAEQLGIPSVEINPEVTEVSENVTFKFASGAAVTLDAIAAHL